MRTAEAAAAVVIVIAFREQIIYSDQMWLLVFFPTLQCDTAEIVKMKIHWKKDFQMSNDNFKWKYKFKKPIFCCVQKFEYHLMNLN